MQTLWIFWRKVQSLIEQRVLNEAEFFRSNNNSLGCWLRRGVQYRELGEQLDVANWYFKDKHLPQRDGRPGSHYIDSLDAPDEYRRDSRGDVQDVIDNNKRPGR